MDGERLHVEDADPMADGCGSGRQRSGAARLAVGGGDRADPLQTVGDPLFVVQLHRVDERPPEHRLGFIDFSAHEQQASDLIAARPSG